MDDLLKKRVDLNPNIMAGKPVIRGTRIPVEMIVCMLANGVSEAELPKEYPRLTATDIRAALAYAASVLANEDVLPLTGTRQPIKGPQASVPCSLPGEPTCEGLFHHYRETRRPRPVTLGAPAPDVTPSFV